MQKRSLQQMDHEDNSPLPRGAQLDIRIVHSPHNQEKTFVRIGAACSIRDLWHFRRRMVSTVPLFKRRRPCAERILAAVHCVRCRQVMHNMKLNCEAVHLTTANQFFRLSLGHRHCHRRLSGCVRSFALKSVGGGTAQRNGLNGKFHNLYWVNWGGRSVGGWWLHNAEFAQKIWHNLWG